MRVHTLIFAMAILVVGFVGSSFAADLQGEESKKDLAKFQGTWVMVEGEWDGKKIPEENAAKSKIIFEEDKITVFTPHQHNEPIIAELVKLDATAAPKQMHFVRKNGPEIGKAVIGIYQFDGDDAYLIAFDPTGATTPKELTAKEKTGHIKHTWKRLQK